MADKMYMKALDANAFTTSSAGAALVNPEVWEKAVKEAEKTKLVVAQLGRTIEDLKGAPGDSFNVTIRSNLGAASALTEGTPAPVSAINYRQVTYTPTEYGARVQITRKERVRSLDDVFADRTKFLGYSLALAKEDLAIDRLFSAASTTVLADDTATASQTSANTLDPDDIINARKELWKKDHEAKYLIIAPEHMAALEKLPDFTDASVYGGREVVLNGEIGRYLGMKVLMSNRLKTASDNSSVKYAMVLDENVFGILVKEDVRVEFEYKFDERAYDIQAIEDYDIQVEYPDGVALIAAHIGA